MMKFSENLFWDVDLTDIDYEKNANQIINRVLLRGNLNDWFEIKDFYGIDQLKEEVVKMRYLDARTLSFCSVYFEIPKTEFRCYNTPQSVKQLWNY